jgi:hypothetical protein
MESVDRVGGWCLVPLLDPALPFIPLIIFIHAIFCPHSFHDLHIVTYVVMVATSLTLPLLYAGSGSGWNSSTDRPPHSICQTTPICQRVAIVELSRHQLVE